MTCVVKQMVLIVQRRRLVMIGACWSRMRVVDNVLAEAMSRSQRYESRVVVDSRDHSVDCHRGLGGCDGLGLGTPVVSYAPRPIL